MSTKVFKSVAVTNKHPNWEMLTSRPSELYSRFAPMMSEVPLQEILHEFFIQWHTDV